MTTETPRKNEIYMSSYGKMESTKYEGRSAAQTASGVALSVRSAKMLIKCTPIILSEKDIARFWSKVDRSGGPDACWEWNGTRRLNGYGEFSFVLNGEHRKAAAHRVAGTIINGPIPEGLLVLHNCPGGDNRACCNPAHHFRGTIGDNNRDTRDKGHFCGPHWEDFGKQPIGETHHAAKLTNEAVRKIRAALASGESQRRIAVKFSISRWRVRDIQHGRAWTHVGPEDGRVA